MGEMVAMSTVNDVNFGSIGRFCVTPASQLQRAYCSKSDMPLKIYLFLTQQIEVGVAAGSRIDDGGKVAREIVGATVVV